MATKITYDVILPGCDVEFVQGIETPEEARNLVGDNGTPRGWLIMVRKEFTKVSFYVYDRE